MTTEKRCSKCRELKPLCEFGKNRSNKDGLQWYCNACRAAYRVARARQIAAYSKRWREAHPDYDKRYREENCEKRAADGKRWAQANPEKRAAIDQRRSARKLAAMVEDFDIMEVWERDGYTCVYCGAGGEAIDHIVPLSQGGPHSLDNLCVACKSCNSSKGAKDLDEWVQWKAQTT